MFELQTILAFALAAFIAVIIPGPNLMYIITRGMTQGRSAAYVSVLGVQTGTVLHVCAAAFGLSALIASSEVAFTAVRWMGAGYLVVLGVIALRSRAAIGPQHGPAPQSSLWRLYSQGLIVNVLNPKMFVFFLALLPQFVNVQGSVTVQVLALGFVFMAISVLSDLTYATVSGSLGARLQRHAGFDRIRNRASGAVYVLLGVLTVMTGTRLT